MALSLCVCEFRGITVDTKACMASVYCFYRSSNVQGSQIHQDFQYQPKYKMAWCLKLVSFLEVVQASAVLGGCRLKASKVLGAMQVSSGNNKEYYRS